MIYTQDGSHPFIVFIRETIFSQPCFPYFINDLAKSIKSIKFGIDIGTKNIGISLLYIDEVALIA